MVITAGSQLGTIVVYGSHGANQAGFYFLALTIVTGIIGIMNSLFSIALPKISGLTDYRKRFAWQAIRLSAVILLPFACSLIFYADDVMRLFGDVYVTGSISLQILLLSILPTCVATGISTLNFAYGNYKYVLIVGLAISVSQTLLYFILAPFYSGVGVAIGYTTGTVLGLVTSIPIARKIGLILHWKHLAIIFIVPTAIGYTLNYLHLNYVFGILLTIISSYILLLKFSIVTRSDIRDILQVLPESISNAIIKLGSRFKKS